MLLKKQLLSQQNLNNAFVSLTTTNSQTVSGNFVVAGGQATLKNSYLTDNASSSYLRISPQGNKVIIYNGANNQELDIYGSSGSDSTYISTTSGSYGLIDINGVPQLNINTSSGKPVMHGTGRVIFGGNDPGTGGNAPKLSIGSSATTAPTNENTFVLMTRNSITSSMIGIDAGGSNTKSNNWFILASETGMGGIDFRTSGSFTNGLQSGNSRLRILDSGYIGINMLSPNTLLHLRNTASSTATTGLTVETNPGFDAGAGIVLQNSNTVSGGASNYGRINITFNGQTQAGNDSWNFGARSGIIFKRDYNATGTYSNGYAIQHRLDTDQFGILNNSANPIIMVNQSSQVAINSTSASYTLDVNGVARTTGAIISSFSSASTGANLELGYDGTEGVIQAYDRTNNAWKPLWLNHGGGTVYLGTTYTTHNTLDDGTGASTFNGNVDAGSNRMNAYSYKVSSSFTDLVNNAPWYGLGQSNLTIAGAGGQAVQVAGYWGLNFQTNNTQMVLTQMGKVGINTNNPGSTLDINGTLHTSSDVTIDGNLTLTAANLKQIQTPYIGFNNGYTQPSNSNNVALFPNNTSTTLDIVGWSNGWRFIPISTSSYASPVATIDNVGNSTFRTITSNVATGTSPLSITSTTNVNNLSSDMVDGFHANTFSGQPFVFGSPASTQFSLIATLPSGNSSTYDHFEVEVVGGQWVQNAGKYTIYMTNRGGFMYRWSQHGKIDNNNIRVVAYQQTDTSVQVYLVANASNYTTGFLRANFFNGGSYTPCVLGVASATVPSGTIVFDTASSSYLPNADLQVGPISTNSSILCTQLQIGNNGSTLTASAGGNFNWYNGLFFIDTAHSRVGINSTSLPNYTLDVNGTIHSTDQIIDVADATRTNTINAGGVGAFSIKAYSGGYFTLYDNYGNYGWGGGLTQKSQNVGISNTNPQYPLDVNGTTHISGNLIVTGTISGNVTSSPTLTDTVTNSTYQLVVQNGQLFLKQMS